MAKTKRPKCYELRRSLPLARSRSIRHYATRTGEMIWAWNRLHWSLQRIFVRMVTPQQWEAGDAMWHSLQSDRSQRNILRAGLQHLASKASAWAVAAMWLLDAVEELAPRRNDATHVPTKLNWTESGYVTASPFANPANARRLTSQSDLRRFHRLLRDDLYTLTNYADAISREMEEPGRYGRFPQPPVLQSISQKAPPGQLGPGAKTSGRKTKPRT